MTQENQLSKLSRICDVIIDDTINFAQLHQSLSEMKQLFLAISEIDMNSDYSLQDIHHETGKAIGPKWAELCIDDLLRTKRFSKGAFEAISLLLKSKKEKPVTILYVGTGPFATLLLPLLTKFKPEELQLILVEINPISLKSIQNCITKMGFEAYIKDIICEDASKLQLKNPKEIDILLLECLQFALVKEQQVAITYNLIPQLKEDVILIPEEIKLNVCLINSTKKMEYQLSQEIAIKPNYFKNIDSVFLLNKETIQKRNKIQNNEQLVFPETITLLSEDDKKEYDTVTISTEISVFGDQILEIDQCSLTMVYKIASMEIALSKKGIKTQYEVNQKPGLKIDWV
jgi:predicted RNA methylase